MRAAVKCRRCQWDIVAIVLSTLVVDDKVYILDTTDKAALDTLDKQAGAKATVTGTEKDNTITVSSVKAAQ